MLFKSTGKHKVSILDFIPAFSGLVGKVALVSSFALVWAQELELSYEDFVFENVRLELLIGGVITLLAAFLYREAAPAGTLSPLVVMIPIMVAFGVHPLILGLEIGILGFILVKSGFFRKLISLAGEITRTSVTLAFGIAGIWMSANKLSDFFEEQYIFYIVLICLFLLFIILLYTKKNWLMIPVAALVALSIPLFFGIQPQLTYHTLSVHIQPEFWWYSIWGIGYGFDLGTIFKTLPFALFSILLWTLDTISIQEVEKIHYDKELGAAISIEKSFYMVSFRNILGVSLGGAQTSSLWRSYLVPLFMVNRPMRNSAIILGILAIITSFFSAPIQLMSFTPLVWSVLLFGIFMPFTVIAIKKVWKEKKSRNQIAILAFTTLGIIVNPIFTWIAAVLYERILWVVASMKK